MPNRPPHSRQRPRPGLERGSREAGAGPARDGEMLRDLVLDLVAKQRALSALIDRCLAGEAAGSDPVSARDLARLMALHSQNAARLGRLLRDKHALSGDDGDSAAGALDEALDALSAEWGIKL